MRKLPHDTSEMHVKSCAGLRSQGPKRNPRNPGMSLCTGCEDAMVQSRECRRLRQLVKTGQHQRKILEWLGSNIQPHLEASLASKNASLGQAIVVSKALPGLVIGAPAVETARQMKRHGKSSVNGHLLESGWKVCP